MFVYWKTIECLFSTTTKSFVNPNCQRTTKFTKKNVKLRILLIYGSILISPEKSIFHLQIIPGENSNLVKILGLLIPAMFNILKN